MLCLGLAGGCVRLPIGVRRGAVKPLRDWVIVELCRQVPAGEHEPGTGDCGRLGRIGEPLGGSELVDRSLEVARAREGRREGALYRQPLAHVSGPPVDLERLSERNLCGRIISPSHLELAEAMQGRGGLRVELAGPPHRDGLAILVFGTRELAFKAGQTRQVHEVRGGHFVPPVLAVQRERGLEMRARLRHIPALLGQQSQVVVVGSGAPAIADPLPEDAGAGVALICGGEIAPVLAQAGQGADAVRVDLEVPDCRRQRDRALQLRLGAVETAERKMGRPDVAVQSRNRCGVGNRRGPLEGSSPDRDGRGGAVPTVGADAHPSNAVRPEPGRTLRG